MPYNKLSFVSDYARYMGLVNEACENVNTKTIFSQESIDLWKTASANPNGLNEYGVPNYVAYPNTNWFDEIFHTGYSQEHNLSVSGSSEKVKYMLSLGYLDNQGVMNKWNLDSSTQKIDFRTNLEAKILKWLTIGTRLYGQKQDYGMPSLTEGGSGPCAVTGKEDMLERIRYERRVELCLEGIDFFDEMRWGTYKQSKFQGNDVNGGKSWWGDLVEYNWYYTDYMLYQIRQHLLLVLLKLLMIKT